VTGTIAAKRAGFCTGKECRRASGNILEAYRAEFGHWVAAGAAAPDSRTARPITLP